MPIPPPIYLHLTQLSKHGTAGSADVILGEVSDSSYEGQIQLHSLDWDAGREAAEGEGSAKGEGVAVSSTSPSMRLSQVTVRKLTDLSTCALLSALTEGKKLNAVITVAEPYDQGFKLKIKLTGVQVRSYELSIDGDNKGGYADEIWGLAYQQIRFEYGDGAGVTQAEFKRQKGTKQEKPAETEYEEKLAEMLKQLDISRFDELVAKAKKLAKEREAAEQAQAKLESSNKS